MKSQQLQGYIPINGDHAIFVADRFNIKILPQNPEFDERKKIFERFKDQYNKKESFILAQTSLGNKVSFLLQRDLDDMNLLLGKIEFNTPIVVKSTGNTKFFNDSLTCDWNMFHSITFQSGNINTIRNPKRAATDIDKSDIENILVGERKIRIKPFEDYTHRISVPINDTETEIVISTFSNGVDDHNQRELGFLDSFIRFSFDEPQNFNSILHYYRIISKLVALFTRHRNIQFDTSLSQRTNDNKYNKTANCQINDGYKNYKREFHHKVISIDYFFENENTERFLITLFQSIADGEANHIYRLLPSDNEELGYITLNDLANLISALEVEYNAIKCGKVGNDLIDDLKEKINNTIDSFMQEYPELDVYSKTNIGSAFKYLDYTLKDKIYNLYENHVDVIDPIVKKWELSPITLDNIGKLVRLRNKSLHRGSYLWDGSEELYEPLLALVYASFFQRLNCSKETVKDLIDMLF